MTTINQEGRTMINRIPNNPMHQNTATFGKGNLVMREKDIVLKFRHPGETETKSTHPVFDAIKIIMDRAQKNKGFKKAMAQAPDTLEVDVKRHPLNDWAVRVGVSSTKEKMYRGEFWFKPVGMSKKNQTTFLSNLTHAVKRVSKELVEGQKPN